MRVALIHSIARAGQECNYPKNIIENNVRCIRMCIAIEWLDVMNVIYA